MSVQAKQMALARINKNLIDLIFKFTDSNGYKNKKKRFNKFTALVIASWEE